MVYYRNDAGTLYQGDVLEVMGEIEDSSVDLIVTDPPYFRVKSEWWDRQWDTEKRFLAWIELGLLPYFFRILKPNGSIYLFASPKMAAKVELVIGRTFNVLNRIRWVKADGWHKKADKGELRGFLSPWEEIIFAEHKNADNVAKGESGWGAKCDELRGFVFEPIRAYLDGERRRANIDKADCNAACGFSRTQNAMASRHYFSQSQWCLPTEPHYSALQRLFNAEGRRPAPPFEDYHPADGYWRKYHVQPNEYLRADYEDLRADYEDLRADYEYLRADYEDLRRYFSVTPDVPYTDVWDFPTVAPRPGKHPCEKPESLIEHIITTSSREGAMVADFFCGSGVVPAVAERLGRKWIASDISEHWCEQTVGRLSGRLSVAKTIKKYCITREAAQLNLAI